LSQTFLQEDAYNKENLREKLAVEQYARKVGVNIEHYHADNRMFADNTYMNDIKDQGQKITYCGVNLHQQNCEAEKCIRDVQERFRIMILDEMHQSLDAIMAICFKDGKQDKKHHVQDTGWIGIHRNFLQELMRCNKYIISTLLDVQCTY